MLYVTKWFKGLIKRVIMKKKILLVAALILSSLCIFAEDGVILLLQDGSKIGFVFSKKPVVKTGTMLEIKTANEEVSYEYSSVKDVSFGDVVATSVQTVNDSNAVKNLFRLTADGIEVEGLNPKETVSLYSIDGKLINKVMSKNGKAEVSLSCSDKSVYIVRTSSGASFKFNRK